MNDVPVTIMQPILLASQPRSFQHSAWIVIRAPRMSVGEAHETRNKIFVFETPSAGPTRTYCLYLFQAGENGVENVQLLW
jgi:hypothetical protein